jgi:pimeloyl-ACP methyl ester carboxylesterase
MSSATIRRHYADGDHGQLHLTELGRGDPLILLHWAPSNARQYAAQIPAFAQRGFRVIAVDIPGYGRSHKDAAGWSCARRWRPRSRWRCGRFGVTRGYALGGHLSAAIVAELAIAEPAGWPRIVLDGSPTLTAEEMSQV